MTVLLKTQGTLSRTGVKLSQDISIKCKMD